jgi:hypothetical protein
MRKLLIGIALLTGLTATSCIGPNNAFNGVTAWNTRVTDSKWWNELIYVGMWVVPVYEVVFTLDVLVFNSFEFWGGENPIDAPGKYENQGKK